MVADPWVQRGQSLALPPRRLARLVTRHSILGLQTTPKLTAAGILPRTRYITMGE